MQSLHALNSTHADNPIQEEVLANHQQIQKQVNEMETKLSFLRNSFHLDLEHNLPNKIKQERLSKEDCLLLVKTNTFLQSKVADAQEQANKSVHELQLICEYLAKLNSVLQSCSRNNAQLSKLTKDKNEVEFLNRLNSLIETMLLTNEDVC